MDIRDVNNPKKLSYRYFHQLTKGFIYKVLETVSIPDEWLNDKNLTRKNSKVWKEIYDEFFEHEQREDRVDILKKVFAFFIVLYETDLYYTERIDWILKRIIEKRDKWEFTGNPPRKKWWKE